MSEASEAAVVEPGAQAGGEPGEGASGWVVLVPTPVGNLGDITHRAVQVLQSADAVACEDTRHTRTLLRHLGVHKPLERFDAHTAHRAGALLARYPRLALVSDAGTPGISDPGAELLRAAVEAGVRAEVLPGPTAFVPALLLSLLPAARFTFEGFLPRGGRERRERLSDIAARPHTSVLYESPHRLHATLADLAAACGPERPASVSRELSKRFEETVRGTLAELTAHFAPGARGEIVVVIGGRDPQAPAEAAPDYAAEAAALAAQGRSVRDIRAALMAQGLAKNEAYALALAARPPQTSANPEES